MVVGSRSNDLGHRPIISRTGFVNPSTRAPALAGGSGSGFRPTGVVEGATGLPVGLHLPTEVRLRAKNEARVIVKGFNYKRETMQSGQV